ncbi:MAG: hypothetical protein CMJ64_18695 [Planctomycetaceae bacterium]|nr:hypothetical protein [Planctomycetaceae bacterium]
MALVDINWNPSRKDLRIFSLLLIAFGAIVGGWLWSRNPDGMFGKALLLAGVGIGGIGACLPGLMRPFYVTWMALAFPIGWTVSHAMMAATFYLVVTPIGLMMRLCGRDPMQRRIDREAKTYWIRKPTNRDIKSYFRQY